MTKELYRYEFHESADPDEIESTILLAVIAAESLHGQSRVRLETSYSFDAENRVCVIDATTHMYTEGRAPEVDDVADALIVQTIAETSSGGEAVLVSPLEDGPSVLSLRRHHRFSEYLERLRSRRHLVQHHTKREQIAPRIHALAQRLLR